jgi:hypothetical protein
MIRARNQFTHTVGVSGQVNQLMKKLRPSAVMQATAEDVADDCQRMAPTRRHLRNPSCQVCQPLDLLNVNELLGSA